MELGKQREKRCAASLPGFLNGIAYGLMVVPTGVRGCEKTNSRPRDIRRGMSVGSMRDVGRGDGRLQLVFCYSVRDETGRFELEGRRE